MAHVLGRKQERGMEGGGEAEGEGQGTCRKVLDFSASLLMPWEDVLIDLTHIMFQSSGSQD